MIHKSGQRAANLTRQLLAFSRRQVLRPKVVGLNTIVSEMTGMLRHLIPENIALNTALADDLSSVKADPSQIEQVLMNLAVNARDAMPNGGRLLIETANVTLDDSYCRVHPYVRPGRYVMLAVSDNGCGMTPDVKAHLFEPFFTTKEQGKGTGLGLATVYGIVKQSGGSIEAYSEPGRGTVFKTYLPVVAPSPTHTAVSSGTLPAVPGGGETILVVEDEDGVRDLIHDILQANGYKVLIAHDGAEALKLCAARKQPVSLVLTDMVMPGMSGLELSHLLARKHPSLKVIFMSGYTDLGVFAGDVLESGAAYLQKPFTPRVLTGTVRDVLDARLSDRRK
jgi:CheY-like chemotaxis protein